MRVFTFACLLFAVLAYVCSGACVRQEITVTRCYVTVGDVFEVLPEGLERWASAEVLKVAPTGILVNGEFLKRRIERTTGIKLNLKFPEFVKIRVNLGKRSPVIPARVKGEKAKPLDAAREDLEERLSEIASEEFGKPAKVILASVPLWLNPDGSFEVSFERLVSGMWRIRLRFPRGAVRILTAKILFWGNLYRARCGIRPGEVIKSEDVALVKGFAEDPSFCPIGMVAKRYIPAGQVVGRKDVKEPPAVVRGEPVEVVLVAEGFTVKLVAEAITSGKVGSVVLVRNRSSGKVFKARVVGKGRVMVRWGG